MHSISLQRAFAGLGLAFRTNGSLLDEAVLEQLNAGLKDRGGFKSIPISLGWRDT